MVNELPVRVNIEAFVVIILNEESDTEQVPPERFTKNVSEEIEVNCEPVIDKVPIDVISEESVLSDEKQIFFKCIVPAVDVMRGFVGVPEVKVIVSNNKLPLEDEDRNPPIKISIDKYLIETVNDPLLIVKM